MTKFKAGDVVLTHCNGEPDIYGYPLRIWAYDTEDSIGWYGEEAVVGEWQLVRAPLDCGLDLWEIAALPLRAPTAYHMWRRALGIFRLKVTREQARGAERALASAAASASCFLMLAKSEGHNAFFCSGSPERREALEKLGIVGIDQKAFNRFKPQGRRDAPSPTRCRQAHGRREDAHRVPTCCAARCSRAGLAVGGARGRERLRRLAALAGRRVQLDADVA